MPGESERAFSELYERHRREVHAYFIGRIGDRESARDLLQETFLRVWRNLDTVRALPVDRRRAWIFTIARNLTTDAYRGRAARRSAEQRLRESERSRASGAGGSSLASDADDPASRAEFSDQLDRLEAAIARLPEPLRVILSLHVVGGLTSSEVGAAVGEPAGTVRYKLSRARTQLAEDIGGAAFEGRK